MRVLMMARNLVTDLSGPRYATEVSRELAKLGNEVFIPTSNPEVHVENARILKLPRAFGKRSVAPIVYSFYAKAVRMKYCINIVHGNGYTLVDDVTTVHFLSRALGTQLKRFGITQDLPRAIRGIAEKAILRSSKHIIAVSSLVERDLAEFYDIPKESITTIHNGVTLKEFSPPLGHEKEKLLQEYGLDQNSKLLLFVGGSAYERKGFQFLLHALPHISEDVVVIAICRNLSRKYQDLLSKFNVVERVKIERYIPNISEIYRAVDIYVLPTIYDPFPLAALEAMASGLPTVVSSCTGIIDIIEDGKNGIIIDDPSNVAELASAINTLAENDTLRKRMGLNARTTVQELSWGNVTRKILEVYETIGKR